MKKFILGALVLGATSSLMAGDGAALYKKCAACHGANADKSALGKSQVIAGWPVAKTEKALNEYKAKTRDNAGMGALMYGQVATYSAADIKAVAKYISNK